MSNTRRFPLTTKVLIAYLFCSFAVHSNLCTAIHRDFNTVDYPNLLCPISEVSGGALWCESSDGSFIRVHQDKCLRGELPDVSKGPALLPVKSSFHCTEPWSGHRQVLVAYAGTDVPRLSNAAFQFLLDLGLLVAGLWSCGLPIVPPCIRRASGLPLSCIALVPPVCRSFFGRLAPASVANLFRKYFALRFLRGCRSDC